MACLPPKYYVNNFIFTKYNVSTNLFTGNIDIDFSQLRTSFLSLSQLGNSIYNNTQTGLYEGYILEKCFFFTMKNEQNIMHWLGSRQLLIKLIFMYISTEIQFSWHNSLEEGVFVGVYDLAIIVHYIVLNDVKLM